LKPVYPALHWQLVAAPLPLGENEFAGQLRQVLAAEAPSVVEYMSAMHWQLIAAPLPLGENEFAGQLRQVLAAEAPSVVE
jgi:hypothetical protein